MSLAKEPTIRALNRIYCYLRLSGVGEAAARLHLQEAATALSAGQAPRDVWPELERRIAAAEARDELVRPRLEAPPAVQRGQVRYPDT